MKKLKTFKEVFGKYIQENIDKKSSVSTSEAVSAVPEKLKCAVVLKIDIDKKDRALNLTLSSDALLSLAEIKQAKELLMNSSLNLSKVNLKVRYPISELSEEYIISLTENLVKENNSLRGSFSDAEINIYENNIDIRLKHGGKAVLESKNIDKKLSKMISESFGQSFHIRFTGNTKVSKISAVSLEKIQMQAEEKKRKNMLEAIKREEKVFEDKHCYDVLVSCWFSRSR